MASKQQKRYEEEEAIATYDEQESENDLFEYMQDRFWQQVADKLEKHIAETNS